VSHSGNSVLKQSYKDRISRRSPDATSDNPHDVRPMANGRALLPRGLPVLNSLTDRHWVGVALNYELDDHQLLSAREMLHDCHVFQPEARHSSGAAGGPIMATHQPRARHVAN
jgi:hypothetical protein